MSDSDGNCHCQHMAQKLTEKELDDPLAKPLSLATGNLNGRSFIRA